MASSRLQALLLVTLLLSLLAGFTEPTKTTPPRLSPHPAPHPAPHSAAPHPAPHNAPVPAPHKAPVPAPHKAPVPAPNKAPVPAPHKAPVPAPAMPPHLSPPPAGKPCCYKHHKVQVCINPERPVGQCQNVCNTTVCCVGNGPYPPSKNTGGYAPAPSPDYSVGGSKCCFCYKGVRFCLNPDMKEKKPKHSPWDVCARKVCKKYTICFAKERCYL